LESRGVVFLMNIRRNKMIRVVFSVLVIVLTYNLSFASESHLSEGETPSSICFITEDKGGGEESNSSKTLPVDEPASSRLSGFGLLTGYGRASIDDGSYEFITLLFQCKFNIKPFLEKKYGFRPSGLVEFIVEPLLSFVNNPDDNVEVGVSFLVKYGRFLTPRLLGFINGGVGGIYTSQHTSEQSTQGNFIPQIGGGFQYHLTKKSSLVVEYRFRHLSNAGIDHPNAGIDSNIFLAGISTVF
jgi:hypothetical protein